MIRPFETEDYSAFAAIQNAIYPQHPTTAEDEQEGDADLFLSTRAGMERFLERL